MASGIMHIAERLSSLYDREEAIALSYWVAEELTGLPQWQLRLKREALPLDEQRLEEVIGRMLQHEPVQYIFGHTVWNGMDLRLNADTLIPRPETAELIDIVLSTLSKELFAQSIVDIGTGSGCIALAIKKRLPNTKVTGIDISPDAIQIAQHNATANGMDIQFLPMDLFSEACQQWIQNYSPGLIISNPPYIAEHERSTMQANVLDYEPERALFVPNDDPLRFYRRIASFKAPYLAFEINPLFADEMLIMLSQMGYDSSIHLDSAGKQRFILASINPTP